MSYLLPIQYCSQCGASTLQVQVAGEDRKRAVCSACGFIQYQNPRIITCTIATTRSGEILLAQRDIEPRRHLWTLPGGFMELFESLEDSAKREMEEETHCTIKINRLVAVISVPEIGQVHHFFQADLLSFSDQPTAESERVSLFNPTEIPWEQLAFRTVRRALQSFLQNPNALLVANLARDRSMSRLE